MTFPRRTASTQARRHAAAAAIVVGLLAVAGCASDAEGPEGLHVGIPETWPAAIDDGHERYPEIGSMGMGDARWDCPLADTITVDGKKLDDLDTLFWKLGEGRYEVECSFFSDISADLKFAQAADATAFAALEKSTSASEQPGNEQGQDAVTISERDYVLITVTYPTNPAAGTTFTACYLDEATLSRACLDVSGSDERSEDYDARQAAEDLSAILT